MQLFCSQISVEEITDRLSVGGGGGTSSEQLRFFYLVHKADSYFYDAKIEPLAYYLASLLKSIEGRTFFPLTFPKLKIQLFTYERDVGVSFT